MFWSPRQNRVWKPTVVAVNGTVAGGGFHFVVDSDIVVAAEHVTFVDTHVNVGMVGAIENIGLAKRLPLGTALRMTLVGRDFRLTAQRAYQLGLVDELVAKEDLMSTADTIARQIAKNSPAAVSLSMQAIWASLEMSYAQAMEFGWASSGCIGRTRTSRKGRWRSWTSANRSGTTGSVRAANDAQSENNGRVIAAGVTGQTR